MLFSAIAAAACPEGVPALTLGDDAWLVGGDTRWTEGTTEVVPHDGYAFPVVFGDRAVGIVTVGGVHVRIPDPDGALVAALRRGLGLVVAPARTWQTDADVAWRLGAADVPPAWLRLHAEQGTQVGVDGDGVATVLVTGAAALAHARATAARAVGDRASVLTGAGYPLAALLDLAPAGWALVEARTPVPLAALAGAPRATPDPWLTVLRDDPALDGGRREATVSFGARYVEGLAGT